MAVVTIRRVVATTLVVADHPAAVIPEVVGTTRPGVVIPEVVIHQITSASEQERALGVLA